MSMPFLKAVFRSDASHCAVGFAGVFRTISEIQHGEDAPVGWSAELSPWCVTVTGCRRRGAKGNIVAASCLHDPPDRVHHDLWLVDRYHVTGLSSDHQTSSF